MTAPRQGAGPVPFPGGGGGLGVLAPQGVGAVPRDRGLCAAPPRRRRLRRGQDSAAARRVAVGGIRPLGQVRRAHVHARGRAQDARAQADELPGARADLQPAPAQLPRSAPAHGRVRRVPPQRAVGRPARPDARARVHPGRRASSALPSRSARRRSASAICSRRSIATSALPTSSSSSPTGRRCAPAATRSGIAPSRRSWRPRGCWPRYSAQSRGGRLLRAQARVHPARRHRPRMAVRHPSGRFRAARAPERELHRRGRPKHSR